MDPVDATFNWSPGIGDPTFVGWFTAFAYFAAAWLAFRAFKAQKQTPDRRSGFGAYQDAAASLAQIIRRYRGRLGQIPKPARRAAWWFVVGTILVLLGFNKQLDLQSAVTELGRWLARRQGWYDQRGGVQVTFVVVVISMGAAGLVAMVWLTRDQLRSLGLSILGLIFLLTFVAVRASSFHGMDRLLGLKLGELRVNWILELGGIGLVAWAAYAGQRRDRRPSKASR